MRRLLVALSLSAAVASAAAEIPFAPAVHGPAAAHQYSASAGSDGTDFLVVWHDQRALPNEAYATRVSRDGAVLDPTGIRLPIQDPGEARVVWTGSSYLVVWTNVREFALVAARISREGAVIDPPRVLVQDAQAPSVTRAGNRTVIGFVAGKSHPQEPQALFLDADGAIVSRVRLSSGAGDRSPPSVAWNGTHVAAVWTAGTPAAPLERLEGVRFTESGIVDAQPRVLIPVGSHVAPQIASDGRDFVMFMRSSGTNTHAAMHVKADLTPGAMYDLPIFGYERPAFLWSGSHYVVLYDAGRTIVGRRFDREGKPLGDAVGVETPIASGTAPVPRAATNGVDLLVTWSAPATYQSPDFDVHATIVAAATLAPRERVLLSVAARRQTHAVIASSGRDVLAVWNESGGTFARRMTAAGAPIDADAIRLGPPAIATAVAFNGTDYIVATIFLQSGAAVWLATQRIPASGSLRVARETMRPLEYNATSVALAHRAGVTLLVWHSAESLDAVRVAADGSWIDSAPLRIASGRVRNVDIAAGRGPAFLVTWEEYETRCCHGETAGIAIRAARLTAAMTLLDPGGIDVVRAEGTEGTPSVTWNGAEWLVVWQRQSGSGPAIAGEIRARRVAPNGTLLDAPASDAGLLLATNAALPRVAWDGSRYVLAWLDRLQQTATSRIHVGRFTGAGLRVESAVVGEAEALAVSGRPSVAVVAPGRVLVAYARIAREPLYGGVARAFMTTTVTPPPARRRSARS